MAPLPARFGEQQQQQQQRRRQVLEMKERWQARPSGRRGWPRVLGALAMSSLCALCLALTLPLAAPSLFVSAAQQEEVQRFFAAGGARGSDRGHTNNWAVLVCTSKFWFNYRHMANTLGMYRTVKRLGIPDSNIILMLADDAACNTRNRAPGHVYVDHGRNLDLYGDSVEVDYRGYEVTVETLLRVLTGRVPAHTPKSKRLESDSRSNVFLYMTGHGGDEFLKFQDYEEISAFDLADAIEQMWEKRRYHELFFMIDTCQATTMYSKIYSPNVIATGSSQKDENSYSHGTNEHLGVALSDRFTLEVLNYMEKINKTSTATMQDLFNSYDPFTIHSHPGVRTDLFGRPVDAVRITDFFGGVAQVELTEPMSHAAAAYLSPAIELAV